MNLIKAIDSQHAWGYHCPEDFGEVLGRNKTFRKFIYFLDVCNVASILLSPLVGLIRAIVAIYLFVKLKSQGGSKIVLNFITKKRFVWMQLKRAVLEILCLGILLGTLVDAIMTLKNKKTSS